jgi:hypothetical protein
MRMQVGASTVARAQALGLDCGKLARLVAELNDNYSRGNAYATHALLRALLDHIPPLLGYPDFKWPPTTTRGDAPTRATRTGSWTSSSKQTTPSTGKSPGGQTG